VRFPRGLHLVTFALVACQNGGEAADATVVAGSAAASDAQYGFQATVLPLVQEACNCHRSEPILMAPFSLKDADAYANLVGVPSIDVPTMMRVAPGVLNQSYVWHKVSGTQLEVGGKGQIMPPTVPLNDGEKEVFGHWIAAGAPP